MPSNDPAVSSEPCASTVSFAELALFLIGLAQRRAYGEVHIKLQQGQISTVRLEQQFKPGQLPFAEFADTRRLAAHLSQPRPET